MIHTPLGFSISIYGIGAALAAALFAGLLHFSRPKAKPDAVTLSLFTLPLALAGARLFYCLARFDYAFLESSPVWALSVWEGGFLMWGALAGAACGAWAAAKRARVSFIDTLDSMAIPVLAGIAVLRLFEFSTDAGLGLSPEELGLSDGITGFLSLFPFSVQNLYEESQLAIYVWEAAAALVILAVLLRKGRRQGDKTRLMLILYAASQIIFESLRADDCPKWGFVRVTQVLCAVTLMAGCILYRRRAGDKRRILPRAAITLACIAAVGVLEWALDKTPLPRWACYVMMCAVLGGAVAACIYRKAVHPKPDAITGTPAQGNKLRL
ncbi:MAG: prolipoprotein diacylglyceryl transferase [Clostridia bacterium]|nr:prolipoprotein diacylglyceryl transferase [Clostridia bacterium]